MLCSAEQALRAVLPLFSVPMHNIRALKFQQHAKFWVQIGTSPCGCGRSTAFHGLLPSRPLGTRAAVVIAATAAGRGAAHVGRLKERLERDGLEIAPQRPGSTHRPAADAALHRCSGCLSSIGSKQLGHLHAYRDATMAKTGM